jgi:hypothetical protein
VVVAIGAIGNVVSDDTGLIGHLYRMLSACQIDLGSTDAALLVVIHHGSCVSFESEARGLKNYVTRENK